MLELLWEARIRFRDQFNPKVNIQILINFTSKRIKIIAQII